MSISEGAVIRLAGQAPVVAGLRGGVRINLAAGGETGGAYALTESTAPPGMGAPPHIHHTGEEAFYVLAGEIEFHLGDQLVTAPAGSFVLVPRGAPHAFLNCGDGEARYLVLFSPPATGGFFDELAAIAAAGGVVARETIAAVATKYGTEYL